MINYRILVQYEGTRYSGWQKQGNTDRTIQGKLEAILEKMTGESVEVHGSGRTDAGVHAVGQVANFKLKKAYPNILAYLNEYLPDDIAVVDICETSERFHSRLSAKEKTYVYKIDCGQVADIFDRRYTWYIGRKLDIDAVREAAGYLLGKHDFMSFCGNKRMKKSTVREIYSINIEELGDKVIIEITGNGFLQNMIRLIVGMLVEIGLGNRTPENMKEVLEAKNKDKTAGMAPAQGLLLKQVIY